MERVFLCAEFPCDNELLDGSAYEAAAAIPTPTSTPTPTPTSTPTPTPTSTPEPFAELLSRLATLAQEHGDPELAAALPTLFTGDVTTDTHARLTARGLADEEGLVGSWRTEANAWKRVLAGEDVDLAQCGSFALDEWAAAFMSRALHDQPQASHVRRELRDRGIAAFGLA